MAIGQQLSREREGFGLGQLQVARFYFCMGHSVTDARISQIETSQALSAKVERKYRRALSAALEWKSKMEKINDKAEQDCKKFAVRVLKEQASSTA